MEEKDYQCGEQLAFPAIIQNTGCREFGLTKREIFAMAALQGFAARTPNPKDFPISPKAVARTAVEWATALAEELGCCEAEIGRYMREDDNYYSWEDKD